MIGPAPNSEPALIAILDSIPTTARAAVTTEFSTRAALEPAWPLSKSPSALAAGECLLRLECTGVCHTDLAFMAGEWEIKPRLPSIGGHEGVGRVVALGPVLSSASVPGSAGIKLGDRVGTKYVIDACGRCEMCRRGFDQHCPGRKIAGYDVDGTFQEYVVAYVDHLTPIPESLPSAAAAPILCAGVTVYNSLKQLDAPPGAWLVIPGAGGGLGHLGIQYAVARGLRVLAIDTGPEKRAFCLSLGAECFLDYALSQDIPTDVRALTGDLLGAHAALITTSSSAAYVQAAFYVRPQGTVLCLGAAQSVSGLPMALIVERGIKYVGSLTGNRQAVHEALALAALGKVRCHYKERPVEEINRVFEEMRNGKLVGRVVLTF